MYVDKDYDICPYCRKDLSVYSRAGARKHVIRCMNQAIPTYTYRGRPRGRPRSK